MRTISVVHLGASSSVTPEEGVGRRWELSYCRAPFAANAPETSLPQGPAIVGLHVSFADRDGLA